MKRHTHHRLASIVFPRYSLRLDQLNYNALLNEWISDNRSIRTCETTPDLFRFVQEQYFNAAPMDYLEFGVFTGESIAGHLQFNKHPTSRFYGFDSFEGLPENWDSSMRATDFDVGGKVPQINDPRLRFVKGWFNETLVTFLSEFTPRARLLIYIDCDLYSSTLYCLTKLDEILIPGTVIIFDEFFSALHEFRAYRDYVRSYGRKLRPVACDQSGMGRIVFLFE
jgi:O-methyltransferase